MSLCQLPTSADNMALPAFGQRKQLLLSAGCAVQQSTDISCPPGPQQQTCSSQTRQTDARQLHTMQVVPMVIPHTHSFHGPFSGTTRVSQYQKGKANLDFAEARDSEWQWHQLGHMQVCA